MPKLSHSTVVLRTCCSFILAGMPAQITQLFISFVVISNLAWVWVAEVMNFCWLDGSHPVTRTQGFLPGTEARNFSFFLSSGACSCPWSCQGGWWRRALQPSIPLDRPCTTVTGIVPGVAAYCKIRNSATELDLKNAHCFSCILTRWAVGSSLSALQLICAVTHVRAGYLLSLEDFLEWVSLEMWQFSWRQ